MTTLRTLHTVPTATCATVFVPRPLVTAIALLCVGTANAAPMQMDTLQIEEECLEATAMIDSQELALHQAHDLKDAFRDTPSVTVGGASLPLSSHSRFLACLRLACALCYHRQQILAAWLSMMHTRFPRMAGDGSDKEGCMALLKIFVGTMYGGSLDVAEQVQPLFEQAGYTVEVLDQAALADLTETPPDLALFVTSTTGSGDVPGNLQGFLNALSSESPALGWLRYGLIALGDSSYGDTYCGAGRLLDERLADLGATRHGERLEIDAMETFMADDAALPWVESWIPTLPALS